MLNGRLSSFILKAVGILIVVSVAWYFITPGYNRLLLSAAGIFINPGLYLTLDQDTIYIFVRNVADPVAGIHILSLHYGLIVVFSLILATPGLRISKRLVSLGIALVAIFAVHLISVVLFAAASLSEAGSLTERNPLIVLFAIIGADLFPILIWGILSYKTFLRRAGKQTSRDESGAKGYKFGEMKIS